jgi:hypothetical protein
MDNKQTAVDWLIEQILPTISETLSDVCIKELIEIAKAMEKEQQIKFANDFLFHDNTDLTAEQYYNETYNK